MRPDIVGPGREAQGVLPGVDGERPRRAARTVAAESPSSAPGIPPHLQRECTPLQRQRRALTSNTLPRTAPRR